VSARSRFEIAQSPDGVIIRVAGQGTMRQSPGFRQFVASLCNAGQNVWLDLTGCDYLDSTFLGCLISLHRAARQQAPASFGVVVDEAARQRLFSINSLDQFLDIKPTCPAAESDFAQLDFDEPRDPPTLGRHIMHCHRLLADLGGSQSNRFRAIADRLARELDE
jgi:anti-anti-sigma factor